MKKGRYLLPLGIISFVALIFFLSWLKVTEYSDQRMVIGTFVRIDVCARGLMKDNVQSAFDSVWNRFEEVQKRMNAYDPDSDIGRINRDESGDFVRVHEDVYRLISTAIDFNKTSEGVFDITVRPLIDLWRRAGELNELPSEKEIDEARVKIGDDKIMLEERDGQFFAACDGCRIDLGGIAKGYAVDEASRILRKFGFNNFLINAGGDLYAAGKNCRGRKWRVAVRHPRDQDEVMGLFELSDQAITTSGDYEQRYEIEGNFYSHIINPLTGYPQKGNVSATVIAPTAMEADVFSTALMVWTPAKGISFINEQGPQYVSYVVYEDDRGRLIEHWSSAHQQINGITRFDVI